MCWSNRGTRKSGTSSTQNDLTARRDGIEQLEIELITSRAIVTPIYLNASDRFERWHTHNWRMLDQYFTQLGGDVTNVAEYLEFCRCQFDRQTHSPRDEELLNEAQDQTARNLAMLRSA